MRYIITVLFFKNIVKNKNTIILLSVSETILTNICIHIYQFKN